MSLSPCFRMSGGPGLVCPGHGVARFQHRSRHSGASAFEQEGWTQPAVRWDAWEPPPASRDLLVLLAMEKLNHPDPHLPSKATKRRITTMLLAFFSL